MRGVEDITAWERDINNRVTADGLLSVLRLLQDPHHFSPDLRQEMLDILHAQEFKNGIPAGLPDGASGPTSRARSGTRSVGSPIRSRSG